MNTAIRNSFVKVFLMIVPLLAASSITNAQEVKRIELPPPVFGDAYYPIALGKNGVLLLAQTSRNSYGLVKYDTDLQQVWTLQGQIDEKLEYATSSFDGQNVYLLFSKYESNVYQVVKVYLNAGFVESFNIFSIDKIQISDFHAWHDNIYISGSARNQPVILRTSLKERSTGVLPIALKGESELQSVDIDTTNGRLTASFALRKGKSYNILLKYFTPDGHQESQVLIEPDDPYALINGRVSAVTDTVGLMIGTYGYKNQQSSTNSSSQGLFITKITPEEVFAPNYYSFTDFTNFFNFLSDKERDKMEKRIEKKKDKGDELKLSYRLLVHDIIKKDDGYVLVAEVFYPEYRYLNNGFGSPFGMNGMGSMFGNPFYSPFGWGWGSLMNPWNYYGWGWRNQMQNNNGKVFEAWKYTHAIVAGFDKNGKLLWDNSMNIEDVRSKSLQQRVKAKIDGSQVTLSYVNKGKIFKKIVTGSVANYDVQTLDVSPNENEQVKRSENEELNFWYDKYALAWGNQKISGESGRRNVFYLNKIEF